MLLSAFLFLWRFTVTITIFIFILNFIFISVIDDPLQVFTVCLLLILICGALSSSRKIGIGRVLLSDNSQANFDQSVHRGARLLLRVEEAMDLKACLLVPHIVVRLLLNYRQIVDADSGI